MALLAAIRLNRADRLQRMRVAESAFRYARLMGVDEVRTQPIFMEKPPPAISEAVDKVVATSRRKGRFSVLENPSEDVLEAFLSASPYIESVNLLRGGRVMAGLSDAADNLSVQMTAGDWNSFRRELEEILGPSLEYDLEELRD
jgi:hypothetical protein